MKLYRGALILTILVLLMFVIGGCYKANDTSEEEDDFSEFDDWEDEEFEDEEEFLDEDEDLDVGFEDDWEDEEETEEVEVDDEEDEAEEETEVELEDEEEVELDDEPVAPSSKVKKIIVTEGELVTLDVKGQDPDGDTIHYVFQEPLDDNGEWQTGKGDAGSYKVEITASDGKVEITKTIEIQVLKANEPPVLGKINDIRVEEGETVSFEVEVSDPDGDDVTYEISGWMESTEKDTGYEDEGNYVVTVTATDGEYEVSQDFNVVVTDVNRAPDFDIVLE